MDRSYLTTISVPEWNVSDENRWLTHFINHGCTVICNVLSDGECESVTTRYWDWLGSCSPSSPVKRYDPTTWRSDRILSNYAGEFKNCIGHEDFVWDVRRITKPVFEKVWQSSDLVTAFDGGTFIMSSNVATRAVQRNVPPSPPAPPPRNRSMQ